MLVLWLVRCTLALDSAGRTSVDDDTEEEVEKDGDDEEPEGERIQHLAIVEGIER
jgi:hypothetical protein